MAEMFPNAPLLPRLRRLAYTVPRLEEDMGWERQMRLELKSLLTPSLTVFVFEAQEANSHIILDSVASTCGEIRGLKWRKPWFTTHLPHSLSRFSTLRTLKISGAELNDENVGIISRLSSLTHLNVLFDFDWSKQRTAPFNNIHRILGNLETLNIRGINEDVVNFISCVDSSRLHSLVAVLGWEAPRPAASIRNVISSLTTLSLMFTASDRRDDPIDVENLLEPFGHATRITELSIKFLWWTLGWTLDAHLSELLKNFPLLESLEIIFQVESSNWSDMASLNLLCNAAKSCPKLRRIKFVGNINITLLDGPVRDSFTELEELDFGESNARDKHRREVGVDRGLLLEFVESIAPGLSMDRVTVGRLN
jgi:hypothetical protein